MRRGRPKKKQSQKTQLSVEEEQDEHERLPADGLEEEDDLKGQEGKFFACYLLTSLCPRFKGHTYIGFTVNPRRRIRQHNGEIRCGAFRTKRKRPWEMVMCIYGFRTNVAALQFEWAWQHPVESLAVRKAASTFKSFSGVANKIKLAFTMLTLPSWQSMNLTVNFFSTKYKNQAVGCPSLPEHMRIQVCPMDDLPCYSGNSWNPYENDEWDVPDECHGSIEEDDNNPDPSLFHDSMSSQGSNDQNMSVKGFCIEDTTLELGRSEEIVKGLRDSDFDKRVHSEASPLSDSPVIVSSFPRSYDLEDTWDILGVAMLDDKNSPGSDQQPSTSSSQITSSSDEERRSNKSWSIPSEVEIIDVCTPSPCHTSNSGSKRRKLPVIHPEIIDLTESPIVI